MGISSTNNFLVQSARVYLEKFHELCVETTSIYLFDLPVFLTPPSCLTQQLQCLYKLTMEPTD